MNSGNDGIDDFLYQGNSQFGLTNASVPELMTIPTNAGQISFEYVLTCSPANLTAPTVTVPDAYDSDGDGNTTENATNADGHPLIWYCAGTDAMGLPVTTAQGELGASFFWYRDTDPLGDPDFTVVPPTGALPASVTSGPGGQDFVPGIGFTQSDSIYVIQGVGDCLSEPTFVELIINPAV